jgi:hypothetical protein
MGEVRVNEVGDMVLTGAEAMRVLAEPVRLAITDRLTRHGAATTAALAEAVGVDDVVAHLERLTEVGWSSGTATAGRRVVAESSSRFRSKAMKRSSRQRGR